MYYDVDVKPISNSCVLRCEYLYNMTKDEYIRAQRHTLYNKIGYTFCRFHRIDHKNRAERIYIYFSVCVPDIGTYSAYKRC